MPELPEALIASRILERRLRGVITPRVFDDRVLRQTRRTFTRHVRGRRVQNVKRIGKHILAEFDEGALAIHLGMSGKLLWRTEGADLPPHTRALFETSTGYLAYVDVRMFGWLAAGPKARELAGIDKLGPDALDLNAELLGKRLGKGRTNIKTALMDQSRVAGLGNIQVCEALFRARLDPRCSTAELDGPSLLALEQGIKASIEHTLAHTDGEEVQYLNEQKANERDNFFLVYGHQECGRCGGAVERFTQSGRSTFWCPRCQMTPRQQRPHKNKTALGGRKTR